MSVVRSHKPHHTTNLIVFSIDTGIDYTHPVLGGGIGPGHKVIGGFDFVGDAYDGKYLLIPMVK